MIKSVNLYDQKHVEGIELSNVKWNRVKDIHHICWINLHQLRLTSATRDIILQK